MVAELATPKRKEPRVDVDAWGLVAEPRVLLDVTVTFPFAQRYEDKSAVSCGEQRKDNEYPSKAGLAVNGVSVDVFGRHGPALQDLLIRFADLARQHDVDMGMQPRRWLNRWRVRISTEIARGCSRLISTANSAPSPVRQEQPALTTAQSTHTTTTVPPDSPATNCATSASAAPAVSSVVSGLYSSHHQPEGAAAFVQQAAPTGSACGAAADVQTAVHPTTTTPVMQKA